MYLWKEPIEQFVSTAKEVELSISMSQIRKIVIMGKEPTENWREELD